MGEYTLLPIGVDSFEKLIESGYYYVDKTLFIKDLMDMKREVNLFTRPRRFGKTLNMSMLRYFFEFHDTEEAVLKQKKLFQGLSIMKAGEKYTSNMGQNPVIFLTLKSGKQNDWALAFSALKGEIEREYSRHSDVLLSEKLPPEYKKRFLQMLHKQGTEADYSTSLQFLADCLEKVYARKTIVLIDEYDVPLENAYFRGFYDEMAGFLRSLFESAFKTNESLEFAVMTGCLRISRESIFTGLNNLKVLSVTNLNYAAHFGFTPKEVEQMLMDYGKEKHLQTVRKWYDGYLFGRQEVYNPWSVLNYLSELMGGDDALPRPYWANTSSNSIVKRLVEKADLVTRDEMEALIEGGTIEKPIHEDITYEDVEKSQDNLWNFLFFTGYLRKVSERLEGSIVHMTMCIPNIEVQSIYSRIIMEWFTAKLEKADLSILREATLKCDEVVMQREINQILLASISYMDSREAFYHGFLLGLYKGIGNFQIKSNRESGSGRYDMVLGTPDYTKAIVIELKTVERKDQLEAGCRRGLEQIEEKGYKESLLADGYDEAVGCAIAFWRKQCRVLFEKQENQNRPDRQN